MGVVPSVVGERWGLEMQDSSNMPSAFLETWTLPVLVGGMQRSQSGWNAGPEQRRHAIHGPSQQTLASRWPVLFLDTVPTSAGATSRHLRFPGAMLAPSSIS